jgi:hypothetical protein
MSTTNDGTSNTLHKTGQWRLLLITMAQVRKVAMAARAVAPRRPEGVDKHGFQKKTSVLCLPRAGYQTAASIDGANIQLVSAR